MSLYRERQRDKERAAEDFVHLYGNGCDREVPHWEEQGAEYRQQFRSMSSVMCDIEALMGDEEILASIEGESRARFFAYRGFSAGVKWSVAAVLVMSIVIGFQQLYWSAGPSVGTDTVAERYVSRIGEQKHVTLSDGTKIVLNTNTQLVVEMSQGKRRVNLAQGEVFFDVTPDPGRPFVVSTGDREVTVLGTAFSVLSESGHYRVALQEGRVIVHMPGVDVSKEAGLVSEVGAGDESKEFGLGDSVVLNANTVVSLAESGGLVSQSIDDDRSLFEWRTGMLRFDGDSLSSVVAVLNRYSGREIRIDGDQLGDLKVFMNINISSISDAFIALEEVLSVKVSRNFNEIVISGR